MDIEGKISYFFKVYPQNKTEFHTVEMIISKALTKTWDFPGRPEDKTLCFHCRGHRFDPWWGN